MAYYFMVEEKKGKHIPIEISNSKYFPFDTKKHKKEFAYSLQEIDEFTMMFDDEKELRERLCIEGTLPFRLFNKPLSIRYLNKNEYRKVSYNFLYQKDIEYIHKPEKIIIKIIRKFYEKDFLLIKKIVSHFGKEYRCEGTAADVRNYLEDSIRYNRISPYFDELDENNDKVLPRFLKLIILESFNNKYGKVVYKNKPNYKNLHTLIALVNYHEESKNKQEEPNEKIEAEEKCVEKINENTSVVETKNEETEQIKNNQVKKRTLTLGINGRGKKKYNLDEQLKFDI